jgi:hypothetical protein
MRRLADNAPERASKMRLIAHTTAQCDFAQGRVSREHERLGGFDTPPSDPGSGRISKSAFEGAAKVAGTDVRQ